MIHRALFSDLQYIRGLLRNLKMVHGGRFFPFNFLGLAAALFANLFVGNF